MSLIEKFTEEELLILLEAARIGFSDADAFDEIADKLDIAGGVLLDLRDKLAEEMDREPEPETEWDKQKKEYIESGYCKCPYCGGENIEGAMIEVDSGSAYQPVSCNDCNKSWEDVYELVNVEEKE